MNLERCKSSKPKRKKPGKNTQILTPTKIARKLLFKLQELNGVGLLESAQIAESYQMDLEYLRDVLMMSSGRSAAMEDWSKMTFTWAAKDMQIVQQMMDRYDLDLELLKVLGTRAQTAKTEREARHAQGKDWINAGK